MANRDFSHARGGYHGDVSQVPEAPTARSLTTATNVAGALVSVALIAGIGVWGYELMVRDVSGIPVVRANTTEMRVRPEDPGGQLAQHQGLAVNEIAARGQAAGPVDQVMLAPPAVALAAEDQPVVRNAAVPVVQPAPLGPATSAFEAQIDQIDAIVAEVMEGAPNRVSLDGPKVVQARADVERADALLQAQPAVAIEEEKAQIITAPGVRQSARPRLRPDDIRSLIRPAAFMPTAAQEVDATAIPSGTRLVQLGAFDSPEVARTEWTRIQRIFGEMLEGKSRVVQEAQSGGRTFYRLRAMGFVDLNDTRRFCSAVKAEGVDCIPVQVK